MCMHVEKIQQVWTWENCRTGAWTPFRTWFLVFRRVVDYLRLARKSLKPASLKLTRDLDSLCTDLKLYLDLSLDLELTSETWYLFWQDLRLENCFCKNWDLVGLAPKELTLDLSRLTRDLIWTSVFQIVWLTDLRLVIDLPESDSDLSWNV